MKREMINISLQRYGTRMLTAGAPFEANRRDARVLNALKKARYAGDEEAGDATAAAGDKTSDAAAADDKVGDAAAGDKTNDAAATTGDKPADAGAATEDKASEGADEIAQLRADYQAKFGKRPFNGWNAATIREKLAAGGSENK